ncbi:MarR family transcriptional regulator [Phytoactinopolyspora alkaliphila]|uniref:MarR family transcriptional regulator n=1 Tax=Phytoactinopolyspora alkaliphila TaxID=1783498 RepID=A0A6N9YPP1_9ACTN|nr:MarR family transcriptional regulator [Phytoactinopolyspora alkaliphila]NED96900.1 MarR family transcriptional regulator [Phytoactinopolyspora alkaliphila]
MHDPRGEQHIGRLLWDVSQSVGRAFDEHLRAVGGSRPIWLILLTLKTKPSANQRELAAAVGIQGATLTHHLAAMEADGLLTRRRDPSNRRIHQMKLTPEGEQAFLRVKDAAVRFNAKLNEGLSEEQLEQFQVTLAQLRANAWRDDAEPRA